MAHLDEILSEGELQPQLRLLLADRTSPEAGAFFQLLMKYVHRRTVAVSRHCGNALADSEQEEVVAEVLLQLMQGSLASFRGQSIPELYGFVRTIADRTTWRVIRRKERELDALKGEGADAVESWQGTVPRPDADAERVAESPLSESDQGYLRELLAAGSKAELARRAGVSRAAVTQRVQRIRKRIAELAPRDRSSHEVWLENAAREALMAAPVDVPM
jgi:DNA-directed RNA polymerase specialized sigma24 family protein